MIDEDLSSHNTKIAFTELQCKQDKSALYPVPSTDAREKTKKKQ